MGSSIETAVISSRMHLMGFVGVLLVVFSAFTLGSEDAIDCGPDMVSCPGLADCVPADECSEDRADAGRSSFWRGQCVEDDHSRLLDHQANFGRTNSPRVCRDYCSGQGYSFFGVQFRHECFCGNTAPPRSRLATGCNYACPGNNRRTCGGTWRMNVYFV